MVKRLGKRRVLVVGLMVLGLIGAFIGGAYGNHVFSDVPNSAYYHDEVTWLAANGIVAGCGAGKYCPNNSITRGQAAEVLYKFATRTRVGHFSCDPYGFQPVSDTQTFSIGGSGASSSGPMACPVHLPDGAKITKLSVAFQDNHAADLSCILGRQNGTGSFPGMADVATTGTPGFVRLTDPTVQDIYATVDNNLYTYLVYCQFGANNVNLAVWGASVEYTYLGIPAP